MPADTTPDIAGTTLDISRTKGSYERAAESVLGGTLIHHTYRVPDGQQARLNQMWRLYDEFGWSLADIAKAWGVSKQWIHELFHKNGYQLRKAWETPKKKRPQ